MKIKYISKSEEFNKIEEEVLEYLSDIYKNIKLIEVNGEKEEIKVYNGEKAYIINFKDLINELNDYELKNLIKEEKKLKTVDKIEEKVKKIEIDYNGDPFTYHGYEFIKDNKRL